MEKNHYKDAAPEETVKYLKKIIEALGYPLQEKWSEENTAGTFSLRLSMEVPGMDIGSNGKGSTPEYARASAYGELCERLQNQLFSLCREYATEEEKHYIDECYMDLDNVLEMDNAFLTILKGALGITELPVSAQKTILSNLFGTEKVLMRPFYSWKNGEIEWIPWSMAEKFYGSNGMSAGNTLDEAIVQGLSEIAERCAQRQILQRPTVLPDIPASVCEKYQEEMQMRRRLEEKGYHVLQKDCSLGGIYPVAGLIIFREGDEHFGLKLGSHPDLEIAIERTFTEAFQGLSEEQFSIIGSLDMKNFQVDHFLNIYNTFKTPYGRYPWQILAEDADLPFQWWKGAGKEKNNKTMLLDMVHIFLDQGCDVLIRDVSFLGFPSCQILVPGMSELLPVNDKVIRAGNTMRRAGELLKRPEELTEDDKKIINYNARFWKHSVMENSMSVQYNLPLSMTLPGNKYGNGMLYLEMVSDYSLGKFQDAADVMNRWLKKESYSGDVPVFQKAAFHYIQARACGCCMDDVQNALTVIFGRDTIEQVADVFAEPEEIFKKLYPRFNCPDCEKCLYGEYCGRMEYRKILEKLWDMQKKNGVDQKHIRTYLNTLREQSHKVK